MERIASFGGIEDNIAIMLSSWEELERFLGELYERASNIAYSHRILLKYIADTCYRHAEYIARLYYEYEALEKTFTPGKLRKISEESRRMIQSLERKYMRARTSLDLKEILSVIEDIEDAEGIIFDTQSILEGAVDLNSSWPIARLLRVLYEECRIRRNIVREIKTELG